MRRPFFDGPFGRASKMDFGKIVFASGGQVKPHGL